eukprot:467226-Prorocentrum_minimum.AAC.1
MGVRDGNIARRQSKGEGEMTEKAIQYLQDHPSLLMEFDELQAKSDKAFGSPLYAVNPILFTCPLRGCRENDGE